ncbi:hypothetical protein [Alteromonas sp. CYL-A6]|uniref:hypothetical protein n=1 Tax=Alteromonas nitratireducens TaxID=3390813 RepID=UPI0034B84628
MSEKAPLPSHPEPSRGAIETLKAYFQNFRQRKKPAKPKRTWRERFAQLTFSQWTYFAAFILLLFNNEQGDWESSGIVWVGLIAGIGLSREIWHLFHRMWHTMLGKGVFLVLYAATANFALAMAAMKVNIISGIEPAPLKFTLGFTTLVMLPMWIFVASIVLACVMLMAGNLWLLVAGLLRIIRIRVPVHWEDRSFAIISMFLRIVLLPVVISALYLVFKPYVEQVYTLDIPIEIIQSDLTDEQRNQLKGLSQDERLAKLKEFTGEDVIEIGRRGETTQSEGDAAPVTPEPGLIDRMIASFIFNMETYPNSSCAKTVNQRVLTIDDYSMLVAERDETNPLGYQFSIAPCNAAYAQPAQTTQD